MKFLISYSVLAVLFYGLARITRKPVWRVKKPKPTAPTVTLMVLLHAQLAAAMSWMNVPVRPLGRFY